MISLKISEKPAEIYLVQSSTLESISEKMKASLASKPMIRDFGGREVLKLPNDDPAIWKILLHWKIKGFLPFPPEEKKYCKGKETEAVLKLLCQCWIFGEKHDASQFQDIIMFEILRILEFIQVSPELLQIVFEHAPAKSALCELMTEQAVLFLKDKDNTVTSGSLQEMIGAEQNLESFLDAAMWVENIEPKRRLKFKEGWYPFMIGDGPHWVFSTMEDD